MKMKRRETIIKYNIAIGIYSKNILILNNYTKLKRDSISFRSIYYKKIGPRLSKGSPAQIQQLHIDTLYK